MSAARVATWAARRAMRWFDDWTKFLHDYGVPLVIPGDGNASETVARVPVTTYTIDVFSAQPSEVHSSLMDSAAEAGGGYRQEATNAAEIELALARIFGDIIEKSGVVKITFNSHF